MRIIKLPTYFQHLPNFSWNNLTNAMNDERKKVFFFIENDKEPIKKKIESFWQISSTRYTVVAEQFNNEHNTVRLIYKVSVIFKCNNKSNNIQGTLQPVLSILPLNVDLK